MRSDRHRARPWSFACGRRDGGAPERQGRFHLLLLEHGECYFTDYGVELEEEKGGRRERGRIKLCSRSLVFDPSDSTRPCVKYPLRELRLVRGGGFWTAHSCIVQEGVLPHPYRERRHSSPLWIGIRLLHSHPEEFWGALERLVDLAGRVSKGGAGDEHALFEPILEEGMGECLRRFDPVNLIDFRETLQLHNPLEVEKITPLLRAPGGLMLTDRRVYFQPANVNNAGGGGRAAHFDLAELAQVRRRMYLHRQTGLEFFLRDGSSAYYNFRKEDERETFERLLSGLPPYSLVGSAPHRLNLSVEMERWQCREISNYEYLCFLNSASGRSVNDLAHYPVFPWVIADYTSTTLNLHSESTFRDLSKPVGALNPERLAYLLERLNHQLDEQRRNRGGGGGDLCPPLPPPFLYGTHYSTPGYVLYFLLRVAPWHMLCLQNGRFDSPDRMFNSIARAWDSVLNNHSDLKELIPEFYEGDGDFLVNAMGLDLGVTQSGERIGDVILPPWAEGPQDFVRKCREALESEYVSSRLHLWIDLIFGATQRGQAALEAHNLFYHLTYEGTAGLDSISDAKERACLEVQINEFGQCPKQLFLFPHPPREGGGGEGSSSTKCLDEDGRPELILELELKDDLRAPIFNQVPAGPAVDGTAISTPAPVAISQASWGSQAALPVSHDKHPRPVLQRSRDCHPLHRGGITGAMLCGSLGAHTHGEEHGTACAMLSTSSTDGTLKLSEVKWALPLEGCAEYDDPIVSTKRLFSGSSLSLGCCATTLDGNFALTGGWDNSLTLYSVMSAAVLSHLPHAHDDRICALALHEGPERALVVTGGGDAAVRVWHLRKGSCGLDESPIAEFLDLEHPLLAVSIDGSGTLVAGATEGGSVCVWELGALDAVCPVLEVGTDVIHRRWVEGVGCTSDGGEGCLMVATSSGEVLWFSASGALQMRAEIGWEIKSMVTDGHIGVVSCEDGMLRVIRPPTTFSSAAAAGEGCNFFSVVASERTDQPGEVNCLTAMKLADGLVAVGAGCDQGTLRLWNVCIAN